MGQSIDTLSSNPSKQLMSVTGVQAAIHTRSDIGIVNNRTTGASRIGDTYGLPLPEELEFTLESDWSVEEQNTTQQALNAVRSGEDFNSMAETVLNRVKDVAASPFGQRLANQRLGLTSSPGKEVFYNSANNRVFNFTWKFAPRNASEAEFATGFGNWMTNASKPRSGVKLGLIGLPDLFQFKFDSGLRLPAMDLCACTSVSTVFTNGGKPKFHRDGYAAFIAVTGSFTEITIQTYGISSTLPSTTSATGPR